MGHVSLKTRVLGQIIGKKPCVHNRGFSFQEMLAKVCQNVCFDSVQAKFEYGPLWVKN